jgi:hypothetical protein
MFSGTDHRRIGNIRRKTTGLLKSITKMLSKGNSESSDVVEGWTLMKVTRMTMKMNMPPVSEDKCARSGRLKGITSKR